MDSYSLVWRRSAEKELRRLPREAVARLLSIAESLRFDPYPRGARKLIGADRTYRVRTGDYRLVYEVEGERLIVEIVRIAHRKDAYR